MLHQINKRQTKTDPMFQAGSALAAASHSRGAGGAAHADGREAGRGRGVEAGWG